MTTEPGEAPISAALAERYTITGEVGSGAFGRVYRARQVSTGRDVALKLLSAPAMGGAIQVEQQRERFRREMQLCAELSHPHIVSLIDAGDVEGVLYAAFEYLQGPTLREVLETEGRLERVEAIELMSQVLDALACAHEQGVVHRDLKPENIIVTKTGLRRHAMVLDFGLAGFTREVADFGRSRLTATNEMLGTPAYAAPEQLRGEPASPRSDLYSWGLILLECLTGEMVMSGRTAYEALMKQLAPEPVPLPVWLRDEPLGRLLSTVTAKSADRRAVDTASLLETLDRIRVSADDGAPVPTSMLSHAGAEQRQVTVVACGVEVALEEGARLDLEELDQLERGRMASFERIVCEEGGTLARPQPDRLLAVFGYPRAQENDARRAVRLARRLASELGAVTSRGRVTRSAVRIGVHSGLAIVRLETPGPGGQARCHVVGPPLSVASRLEERARASEVLVTEDTRALLRESAGWEPAGEIDTADLGTRESESDALGVYRAIAEHVAPQASSTVRPEIPLVGRASELAQLLDLWHGAETGETGIVLLQGEAGIGKSRLLRELRRHVPARHWLACRCVAEGQTSRLQPIIDLLESLETPIEDLLVEHGFELAATQPLFASLMGIPVGPYGPLRLSPERHKEMTLNAVVALLTRLSADGPKVLAVEDLHWADPTTLELLALLTEECRAARLAADKPAHGLLLLFTARQDFRAAWAENEATRISLGRLGLREVETMVNAGRTESALAPALVKRIAERSDGVPLFVEELVNVLASRKSTGSRGAEFLIPATLRELLAARLDGLSASAYATSQMAAALGREFAVELLEAVAEREGKAEWVLRQDLAELIDARLLYRRTMANAYVFKHSLVRDAAYDSMLGSVRSRIHQRIAEVMLERTPGIVVSRPEVMAHHLYHGGDVLAASEYWHRAGDYELRRAAYEEAIQHLECGLDALAHVPAGPEHDKRELEVLITLGTVHIATKGAAVPEVADTFRKAQEIYDRVGGDAAPLKIFAGLYSTYVTQGNRAATEDILPRFEALAAKTNDPVAEFTGMMGLAVHAFWRGEHERSREYLDRGCLLYRTGEFYRFAEAYGWDQGLFIYGYSVWNACVSGRYAEAEAAYRDLYAFAEASFNPYSTPLALAFGMASAHLRHDVGATLERASRLIELSGEQRMYLWLAIGQCGGGWASCLQGDHDEGVMQLRAGLDVCRMIGAMTPYAYYLIYLADALRAAGALEEGLAVVDEGLELCRTGLARVQEPELLRIGAELWAAAGRESDAEARLREAIDMASRRGAGAWAVRASLSLARLQRARGDLVGARDSLQAAVQEFPQATVDAEAAEIEALVAV